MPRIRIRTSEGERIVGTPNSSTLTIRVIAHAQRPSLQLRADAELVGEARVLEHWTWNFPELADRSTIQLISEPGSIGDRFDPPDASHSPSHPISPAPDGQSIAEIQSVEKELAALSASLRSYGVRQIGSSVASAQKPDSPTTYCSFCGKGQDEVRKLIAGPAVFICDECIAIAHDLAE